ncbi:L-2-hydroxyglutarate oxidase [Arthrobacter sp. H35-D1]|uniref:L-2-hydroxyglutarate oxidase n=1 Tax=Arthrobacter sp. H35-D1 TaxID=3046202 RepID=UPI0024B9AA2F|nr:L-2-hydroxyglutarate oxidase [Arthrobacter sp. H35-D1]MDJ0312308.1 L-2-hydroxyglutarate oxidase [Arthrobacter sp. H35-D1]
MAKLRAAVVGGGIVGVAVARELLLSGKAAEVALYEKEPSLAAHQTGRNSGVVHAGLYYEPGGLKATLCRRGVGLLQELTARRNVPYEECGKVVVARDDVELARLRTLFDRAVANGVPGVRMIDGPELRRIEPHARGIAALHSPTTAITNYAAATRAMAEDFTEAGGTIFLGTRVTGIDDGGTHVSVLSEAGSSSFDLVINCAGLQSDRLAKASGDSANPRIVPFFGAYFLLREDRRSLVNGLIYPVPDPRYPFLGVHLTKRIDGEIMVGPNAFLAGGREAYSGLELMPRDLAAVAGFGGFWRFAAGNIPAALREGRTVLSRKAFIEAARAYVPELAVADVVPGSRGIRAQAMNGDGSLVDDFVITGNSRIMHVRNAPSPGATSSMAIAEHIVVLATTC